MVRDGLGLCRGDTVVLSRMPGAPEHSIVLRGLDQSEASTAVAVELEQKLEDDLDSPPVQVPRWQRQQEDPVPRTPAEAKLRQLRAAASCGPMGNTRSGPVVTAGASAAALRCLGTIAAAIPPLDAQAAPPVTEPSSGTSGSGSGSCSLVSLSKVILLPSAPGCFSLDTQLRQTIATPRIRVLLIMWRCLGSPCSSSCLLLNSRCSPDHRLPSCLP